MAEERNLYRSVRITIFAQTLSCCKVKVPLIRPSTAGVLPRRGGGYLGYEHGICLGYDSCICLIPYRV